MQHLNWANICGSLYVDKVEANDAFDRCVCERHFATMFVDRNFNCVNYYGERGVVAIVVHGSALLSAVISEIVIRCAAVLLLLERLLSTFSVGFHACAFWHVMLSAWQQSCCRWPFEGLLFLL